jgi:hypothetical protein
MSTSSPLTSALASARVRSRYQNTIAISENTKMMVEIALISGVMATPQPSPDFERQRIIAAGQEEADGDFVHGKGG